MKAKEVFTSEILETLPCKESEICIKGLQLGYHYQLCCLQKRGARKLPSKSETLRVR